MIKKMIHLFIYIIDLCKIMRFDVLILIHSTLFINFFYYYLNYLNQNCKISEYTFNAKLEIKNDNTNHNRFLHANLQTSSRVQIYSIRNSSYISR